MCESLCFSIESRVYDWFTTSLRLVYDWFTTGLRLGKPEGIAQVSKFRFPYHAKVMKRDRQRR